MTFRAAKEDEAQAILTLYRSAIGLPLCTWNESYPSEFEISHDIETDNLFVLEEDGQIIGAISIVPENELDAMQCWSNTERANEIARVVLRLDKQGKGYSATLVQNVLNELKERGCQVVHLAVAKVNIPAQRTYSRCGFVTVDECFMYGNDFYLCEKLL